MPLVTKTTKVAEMQNNDEEAQTESSERPQVSTEDLQADLDDNNQMVSEGGPSG
jgi:hypothetical protein